MFWKESTVYLQGAITEYDGKFWLCLYSHMSATPPAEGDLWLNLCKYVEDDSGTDKRKRLSEEREAISEFKKRKTGVEYENLEERITLLEIPIETKSFLLERYHEIDDMQKSHKWITRASKLPFGNYIKASVTKKSTLKNRKSFFSKVKAELDKHVFGLENVKQEILEFIARKISDPNSKGDVLALQGKPGTGKTKLVKAISSALELPFGQINCGGLNDSSILLGHSETYVGAKPGKVVEIIESAGCMNPIIYLDEIDKISGSKAGQVNGVLVHLLDEEQNGAFQDHYFSGIPLDLSKVFFVVAFNEIESVNYIVRDRMKVINVTPPTDSEKIQIAKGHISTCLPETVLEFILHRVPKEDGVRQFKKAIERVLNRANFIELSTGKKVEIDNAFVENVIQVQSDSTLHFYI